MKNNRIGWVILGAALLGGLILLALLTARQTASTKHKQKDLGISGTAELKVVQTDCYGFVLPKIYADSRALGCNYNAYAEDLKDNWINIDGSGADSAEALESEFKARKIDPASQTIVERKTTKLDGQSATTLIDEYKNNRVRYATTLVWLPKDGYLVGGTRLSGFELRAKYTTAEDQRIYDQVLSSWRWR